MKYRFFLIILSLLFSCDYGSEEYDLDFNCASSILQKQVASCSQKNVYKVELRIIGEPSCKGELEVLNKSIPIDMNMESKTILKNDWYGGLLELKFKPHRVESDENSSFTVKVIFYY